MWIRIRSEIAALVLAWSCLAAAQDDPMAPYRDRFQTGYEKFTAGALGEALRYWEPIYRELGPERGYRLAYDIALVYDALGDATRAAEHFESFLEQVKARRDRKEAQDDRVLRDEERARSKLDGLVRSHGRIRIAPTTPAETVRIDAMEPRLAGFVAYVPPGHHVVTFAPGTKEEDRREIDVDGGQIVDVVPAPKPEKAPVVLRQIQVEEVHHPFSLAWIFGVGALAIGSVAAPVASYLVAQSQLDAINRELAKPPDKREDIDVLTGQINAYYATRTAAYVTLAVPFLLAATTAGLALGFSAGTKRTIKIVPQLAGAAVVGAF
jgi:hypothetical protein